MVRPVDQLAELTAYRDRDVLDVSLTVALRDLLAPLSVSVHRVVGPDDDRRWLCRAHLSAGEQVPSADAVSSSMEQLPVLSQFPQRQACLERRELRESASASSITSHFPLGGHDAEAVLELVTRNRLSASERRTVGSMLRVFHNFQVLLDDAERDSLTGLFNRKGFDAAFLKLKGGTQLPSLVGAGDRRHEPAVALAWLGIIDIDHFKRVNDNFGHLIGDEVLLLLARLMRSSFRFHDQLYRFGGEEFVVLLRADSEADAAHAFERLRQACAAYAFPQVGEVTLSIGCTQLRAGDLPAAAFDRADRAVYYAKQNGRNQVRVYERLIADGLLQDEGAGTEDDVELF